MRITLDSVSAGYGRTVVLNELDWEIGPGVTGLLGPNGAGKTTLLHLLAGITRPRRGVVTVHDGERVVTSRQRGYARRIGFVPQHFTFAAEMRVIDTVTYAAWVNGLARRECQRAALAALVQVDLEGKAGERVRTLSGGQRQRLGVATALAHEPELLILDEPTVGLDPSQRLRLRAVIAAVGTHRTVIVSTHLAEDVIHMCEQVGVLAGGRMAFSDAVDRLTARVGDFGTGPGRGSAFEQAYAGLVENLEGSRD